MGNAASSNRVASRVIATYPPLTREVFFDTFILPPMQLLNCCIETPHNKVRIKQLFDRCKILPLGLFNSINQPFLSLPPLITSLCFPFAGSLLALGKDLFLLYHTFRCESATETKIAEAFNMGFTAVSFLFNAIRILSGKSYWKCMLINKLAQTVFSFWRCYDEISQKGKEVKRNQNLKGTYCHLVTIDFPYEDNLMLVRYNQLLNEIYGRREEGTLEKSHQYPLIKGKNRSDIIGVNRKHYQEILHLQLAEENKNTLLTKYIGICALTIIYEVLMDAIYSLKKVFNKDTQEHSKIPITNVVFHP